MSQPKWENSSTVTPPRFAALFNRLGVEPNELDLYLTALNHRSASDELGGPLQTNERLEFLGDSILSALVAEDLYHRFPEASEGRLTVWRAALVRTEQLTHWAREIELGDAIVLGAGERLSGGPRDRVLAGAFEALLGAVALDAGLPATKQFLRQFLEPAMESLADNAVGANPKGRLQELTQERFRLPPEYLLLSETGPAHDRTFESEVLVGGTRLGSGAGASKRQAEEAAARVALDNLDAYAASLTLESESGNGESFVAE